MEYDVITYNPDNPKLPFSFYVQSKGLWSGRPMTRPRPNSFIVTARNKEERLKLFNYVYILWKLERFNIELVGSVIPFLRIRDFKKILNETIQDPSLDHSKIRFVFSLIVILRRKQINLTHQISNLKSLESLYIRKHIKL